MALMPKTRRPSSPEDIEAFKSKVAHGATLAQLAEEFGVALVTIGRWCRYFGIKTSKGKPIPPGQRHHLASSEPKPAPLTLIPEDSELPTTIEDWITAGVPLIVAQVAVHGKELGHAEPGHPTRPEAVARAKQYQVLCAALTRSVDPRAAVAVNREIDRMMSNDRGLYAAAAERAAGVAKEAWPPKPETVTRREKEDAPQADRSAS